MECPYCKADVDTSDFSELNNPNLVKCQSCDEHFYVEVIYQQFAAKETEFGGHECEYNEI